MHEAHVELALVQEPTPRLVANLAQDIQVVLALTHLEQDMDGVMCFQGAVPQDRWVHSHNLHIGHLGNRRNDAPGFNVLWCLASVNDRASSSEFLKSTIALV